MCVWDSEWTFWRFCLCKLLFGGPFLRSFMSPESGTSWDASDTRVNSFRIFTISTAENQILPHGMFLPACEIPRREVFWIRGRKCLNKIQGLQLGGFFFASKFDRRRVVSPPKKKKMTFRVPSTELIYPTLGKGKSSSKCHFWGIC